ncbi:DUF3291 domain-containing protein [Algibacter mikhailovii]|uniref:DUF3291 domain-containing protein n=1 Tax=Algibacter mikhailovii TaxID=425498 RepID=A0A918QUX4_9FLAO|nr:DUF3291 domain-containing protein [Algibacter mikhailovii]GGZ70725.1 hypothetical protein GCM10007028_04910 [Algibacter mikhailovii]
MSDLHLAQVNIARRLAPLDDPIMQDFLNNVERINAIADSSEGFKWRMQDEEKEEGSIIFQDDSLVINISVWENLEALYEYTYKSGHIDVFKRKKEWFSKLKMVHMAFWYVKQGYQPTFKDAKQRLDYMNINGDTPYAFSFRSKFTPEDSINYKQSI